MEKEISSPELLITTGEVTASTIKIPSSDLSFISDEVEQLYKKYPTDAGYDIIASEQVLIEPWSRAPISTGLKLAIPIGYYGMVCSRSGLAFKNGIQVGAGIIDSTYRGEVKCLLFNLSNDYFTVYKGDRIAQLIIIPLFQGKIKRTATLPETDRGTKGFGSTGIRVGE
jgi:dUTP pyrophosphatase